MRIGLDYDGTIANANLVKSSWIRKNLNIHIPNWCTDRTSCIRELSKYMDPEKARKVYNNMTTFIYTGDYGAAAPEIEGALDGIRKLAASHEVVLVTAREEKKMPSCRKWLQSNGVLQYFSRLHSSGTPDKEEGRVLSKAEICGKYNVDVLVDDDERHLAKIDVQGLKRILIKNGAAQKPRMNGIYVASSFNEVVEEIYRL